MAADRTAAHGDQLGTGHLHWKRRGRAVVAPALIVLAVATAVAYARPPAAPPHASASAAVPLAIAAGGDHTCALLAGGAVECWGANGAGQLGDGTSDGPQRCDGAPCSAVPVTVRGRSDVTAIAAGGDDTCALVSGGDVACWGANGAGQLGNGLSRGARRCSGAPCGDLPVTVSGLSRATAIAVGTDHACALLSGGDVACWGANAAGQLGDGESGGPQHCDDGPCSAVPVMVRGISDATAIATGGDQTCALRSGGGVACWGANGYGELGEGASAGPRRCDGAPCSAVPVMVRGLSGATAVAAGARHACALLADGGIDCWGYNFSAELGVGTSSGPRWCIAGEWCSTSPVEVASISTATTVVAGGDHTCALLAGGSVECWGYNSFGQLGDATSTGPQTCYWQLVRCAKTPVAVIALGRARAVTAGGDHTCALLDAGGIDCWGANWFGDLGDGARSGPSLCNYYPCSATPVAVAVPAAGSAGTRR
jgi:alpha-tubulin suppressor-like RCC1 family protein